MVAIGVQLWTVRDRLDADVDELFADLASAGAEVVEPFGLGDPDVAPGTRVEQAGRLARSAAAAGLAVVSAHAFLPPADRASELVDEMGALGAGTAVAATPDSLAGFSREALTTTTSVVRYAQALDALAEACSGQGLRVGYHNHAWEWARTEDGEPAYDRLWRELSPLVVAEVDLLWAAAAGQDVVEVVARLGDRVRLLHAGDASPAGNPEHQLPSGQGDVPLAAALARAPGVEALLVEATTPPPGRTALDLVRDSITWLAARVPPAR
ncbi:TIM barrel protein [Pseudokineococcus basanitobsidens]|uniref:TIM barrel protein n=1 Tax=Pseudokineococcus basanitobsidens TaxID=1926649 RepID=A0ABU8RG50_9ACTN